MPRTFALQPLTFVERPGDSERVANFLPPHATLDVMPGDLVVISGGVVNNLTNAAVANIAVAMEKNPDGAYLAPGPDFATAKPRVAFAYLRDKIVKMSSFGVFAAATHVGVNRGVKRDASKRSYIDLADAATPAFTILGIAKESGQGIGVDKTWGEPADGDTNVPVYARILATAAYVN